MERILPEADREVLGRPWVRRQVVEELGESLRRGSAGITDEAPLYLRPWGFDLARIRPVVHLWHGEGDRIIPVSRERYLERAILRSRAAYGPAEGHFLFVDRAGEILGRLASVSARD